MRTQKIIICIIALAVLLAAETTVKRGRNEGTASIDASNTIGNGNIAAFIDLGGDLTRDVARGDAHLGASLGIAGILQIKVLASALDYSRLGPAEGHLMLTTPGNDKLRFFGLAVSGDLYLSTSLDTISLSADETRPLYSPFLMPSLVMDLDWLARPQKKPVKTYFSFSLVDDPQTLYRYSQLAFTLGGEWKTYQHSVFVDAGVSLYKEKMSKLLPRADQTYEQFYVWLKPGGRYRIFNRFSIIGSLGFSLVSKLKQNTALDPGILSLSVGFEAPLIYRETNTEAIRTLVFLEQKDQKETDSFVRSVESGKGLLGDLNVMLEDLGEEGETFDYNKEEQDLAKRRIEIQKKMQEIELLLQEIE